MLPAWFAACAITAVFLAFAFPLGSRERRAVARRPFRLGPGGAATLVAAALVVTLPNAALPVLAVGVVATVLRRLSLRLDVRVPALLFVLAVGLGSAARIWDGPAQLVCASGPWAA